MKQHFVMMANYNAWANALAYAAAADLSDEDYRADLGAAFHSIHGTLNHLVVGDLIWMHRFTGEGDTPARLDTILHDDLAALKAHRDALDARIKAHTQNLTEADLASRFTYTRVTDGMTATQPRATALAHFFNHQTHHRGQVHALLTRLTGQAPSMDLVFYQRDTGDGL